MNNDTLMLIEDEEPAPREQTPWKVLIVDDEQEVHDITRLALADFTFAGRPLLYLHAYTAKQAIEIVSNTDDIAVMLVDVVMESDHAGLDFVRYVRETAGLKFVRIVLRTGQPGQAPERKVITEYDINDYKQKTELTQERMFSVMHTSISSYRDLVALDYSRRGLRKVIEASASLLAHESMEQFAQGVLEQLAALLYLDNEALILRTDSLAAEKQKGDMAIIAGTGRFSNLQNKSARENLPEDLYSLLASTLESGDCTAGADCLLATYTTSEGNKNILYVAGHSNIAPPDRELIQLFCRCVATAQDNLLRCNSQAHEPVGS